MGEHAGEYNDFHGKRVGLITVGKFANGSSSISKSKRDCKQKTYYNLI
jgi:hypothetical protein